MRDFHGLINLKFYRITIALITLFMVIGLFNVAQKIGMTGFSFYFHSLLAFILIILLWFYPRKETTLMKAFIIIISMVYFYTLFILYPANSSTYILLCLSPGIAILFFQPFLFYLSLTANIVMTTIIFWYMHFAENGELCPYLFTDMLGNYITFLGSQVVFFLIFHLSLSRIKKQQVYYEQIQQAERFKTTGQLAAAVAHEIRNPITVVKGFLQFYQEDQEISKEKRNHFALMLEELNIAETVISDFLSIAKTKDEKDSAVINVKEALRSVVDLIHSYAMIKNIRVSLDVEKKSYITCSLMEFKQLMINLLKNAIEASPYGGFLNIEARETETFLEIKVIDNGDGMTDEELTTIGTPYYSLKSKGTGLGLMICFNIIEKYHGTIQFKSKKGEGTTVVIRFPVKSSF